MSNRVASLLAMLASIFVGQQCVFAQVPWYVGTPGGVVVDTNGNYAGYGVGYGGGYGYGYGGYGLGGWGGAQTPISAGLTGMGNLVRAEGAYNEASAKSLVYQEQAREKYLENQKIAIANRQTLQRASAARNAEQAAENKAARAKAEAFESTHRTPPMMPSEYNATTGQIRWPDILKAPEYDGPRGEIDGLFKSGMKTESAAETAAKVQTAVGHMKDTLRGQITSIPLNEYSECRRFLDRVAATLR